MPRQLILTKENMRRFAHIGSQDGKMDETIVVVKFFTPDSNWTWLATEMSFYDDTDNLVEVNLKLAKSDPQWTKKVDLRKVVFFGYVIGLESEWGSFALCDIMDVRGRFGLPVERDVYSDEMDVKEHCKRKAG